MKLIVKIYDKGYKLIVMLLVLLITVSSCVDLDEVKPAASDPNSFLTDLASAEAMLAGVYGALYGDNGYMKKAVTVLDVGSDEMGVGGTTDEESRNNYDRFVYSSGWGDNTRWWFNQYQLVQRGGYVIDKVSEMDTNIISAVERDKIVAEARVLRALGYFNLIRLWGDVPFFGDRAIDGLGDRITPRVPVGTIYDFLEEDIKKAIPDLYVRTASDVGAEATSAGRVSQAAAQTLLADIYLTRAGKRLNRNTFEVETGDSKYYQMAADMCAAVISSPAYGLMDDYRDVFPTSSQDPADDPGSLSSISVGKEYNKEHVWVIQCNAGGGNRSNESGNYWDPRPRSTGSPGGYSSFVGEPYIFYLFDSANDKRFDATFKMSVIRWTSPSDGVWNIKDTVSIEDASAWKYPYPHINKILEPDDIYFFPPQTLYTSEDRTIYRFAEVLLIYAEALNEANTDPPTEAIDAFNLIRTRAGLPLWPNVYSAEDSITFSNDKAGFREAIKQERIFELCFEQKRKYDLLRWGEYMSRFEELVELGKRPPIKNPEEIYLNDEIRAQNIQLRNLLMPIPSSDLAANPNLEQNPGY